MQDYQKKIEDLFREYDADKEGLSGNEVALRLDKYGFNRLHQIKKTPLIFKFFAQFKDLLAIILIVAGVLTFFISESWLIFITIS